MRGHHSIFIEETLHGLKKKLEEDDSLSCLQEGARRERPQSIRTSHVGKPFFFQGCGQNSKEDQRPLA